MITKPPAMSTNTDSGIPVVKTSMQAASSNQYNEPTGLNLMNSVVTCDEGMSPTVDLRRNLGSS